MVAKSKKKIVTKKPKNNSQTTIGSTDSDLLNKNRLVGIIIAVIILLLLGKSMLFIFLIGGLFIVPFPLNLIVYGGIAFVLYTIFKLKTLSSIDGVNRKSNIVALTILLVVSIPMISFFALVNDISQNMSREG